MFPAKSRLIFWSNLQDNLEDVRGVKQSNANIHFSFVDTTFFTSACSFYVFWAGFKISFWIHSFSFFFSSSGWSRNTAPCRLLHCVCANSSRWYGKCVFVNGLGRCRHLRLWSVLFCCPIAGMMVKSKSVAKASHNSNHLQRSALGISSVLQGKCVSFHDAAGTALYSTSASLKLDLPRSSVLLALCFCNSPLLFLFSLLASWVSF